jgi:hypothetical protein
MRAGVIATAVLAAALLLPVGCERTNPSPAQPVPATSAPSTRPSGEALTNLGGLAQERGFPELPPGHPPVGPMTEMPTMPELPTASRPAAQLDYTVPDTWQKETPRGMLRLAQYRLPRADDDPEDGEVAVFGSGIGGSIDAIVQMWRSQFTQPDGQPIPEDAVVRQTLEAGGMQITVVDIAGNYSARSMMPGASAPAPKDGYRMLAAIVETPAGPWYFKATGPAHTIAAHREEFMNLLRSIKAKPAEAPPR